MTEGEDGGGFACTWGPVEEQMGEVSSLEGAAQNLRGMRLSCYVVERLWAAD